MSKKLPLLVLLLTLIIGGVLFAFQGNSKLLQGRFALPATTRDVEVGLVESLPTDIYGMDQEIVLATYEIHNTTTDDFVIDGVHFAGSKNISSVSSSPSIFLADAHLNQIERKADRFDTKNVSFENLKFILPAGETATMQFKPNLMEESDVQATGQKIQATLKQLLVYKHAGGTKYVATAKGSLSSESIYIFSVEPLFEQTSSEVIQGVPVRGNHEVLTFDAHSYTEGAFLVGFLVHLNSPEGSMEIGETAPMELIDEYDGTIWEGEFTATSATEGMIEINFGLIEAALSDDPREFTLLIDTSELIMDSPTLQETLMVSIDLGDIGAGIPSEMYWTDQPSSGVSATTSWLGARYAGRSLSTTLEFQ